MTLPGEKQELDTIEDVITVTVGGVTETETVQVGQFIRANPSNAPVGDPSTEYIRLQMEDGRTFKWNDALANWSLAVDNDPDDPGFDVRWVPEG